MPSNWLVFDRIRALAKQYKIYQVDRAYQDQPNIDRLTAGGDFLDLNQQAAILDQTNLQINRLERYKDYEQMDQTGEISLALDLYSDEASLCDPERKHTLIIRARNRRLKKELEDLFFNTLRWDSFQRPASRYLCKYGDAPFEIVLDANRESVSALKFMNVYNFTRIETRYGDLVGFFYMDAMNPKPIFMHPWQVMHMRLTSFENIYAPYGRCADMRSQIAVPGGYKELRDLNPGDTVYSFNGLTPTETRVIDSVCSGYKPSILIKTKYRELRVSEDHPILAVMGGAGGRLFRRYVPAKHVVPGSQIIVHDPEYDDDNSYMAEEVLKQKEIGRLEVGDIQVDSGYHNFVANGAVIHNCIKLGTPVMTPDGFKAIEDFVPGDRVYCYDGDGLVETVVTAAAKSGVKAAKTIITDSSNLTASLDHLVLCNREGQEVWVKVEDLVIGDLIVAPRPEEVQREVELEVKEDYVRFNTQYFDLYRAKGIGYKSASKQLGLSPDKVRNFIFRDKAVSRSVGTSIAEFYDAPLDFLPGAYGTTKTDVEIPAVVDNDFATLFGFLLGDGWLTSKGIEIALGTDAEINETYIKLLEKLGKRRCTIRRQGGREIAAVMSSSVLTKLFRQLGGLDQKCYDKFIPEWCFSLSNDLKASLIQGLLDSDGCAYFDRKTFTFRYTSSSRRLVEGLRILLTHLGHKFSNVHERLNKKFNNPLEHTRPVYSISFYQTKNFEDGEYKRYTKIRKIKEAGLVETADIQVENNYSNFIAGGLVVHNSILDGGRKAFKQLRLMEDAALIYRICVRGDSLVWTPTGHTPIKDLKIGDVVYCFKDGKPKVTKVVDWQCNGKDVIYRVYSQHRELFCNASHPILVETSYSNKRDKDRPARLEYVDVKDIIAKRNGVAKHHRFLLPQLEHSGYVKLKFPNVMTFVKLKSPVYAGLVDSQQKTILRFLDGKQWMPIKIANAICDSLVQEKDYEYCQGWCYDKNNNICREYNIPEYADEDFARWFGFMIGDGYISERLNNKGSRIREVGMALGDCRETNDKYIKLFNQLVVHSHHAKELRSNGCGKQFVYSKPLVEFLKLNGFIAGAANKRIPDWVFQSPRSVQEAFVDGYIDADGHKRIFEGGKTESCEVDCCNEMLLRDLKELCHRLGWNVGLIRKHERVGGREIEPGRVMKDTTGWSLYFTKTQLAQPDYTVKAGYRYSNTSEAILGVEEIGEDLVYDITIEDDVHNMIVNGIPTAQTRAPEKRKFFIPVGMIPPKEVPEYMQMIARNFKRQRFYNPSTGSFDERYSPLIQEDDFFLPKRPDGSGPDVDVLPGAENLDQIADIEYFKKKMVAPLKIPFARVGIGEGAGDASEKSLSQSHAEFAKAVQWVQREMASQLTKVALVHLALRGYRVDDLRGFELALTATSAMEELYRIETWQTRVSVMADLKELGWFPKEWIVTHFTDLSPDEIQELEEMEMFATTPEPTEDEGGKGIGGPGGLGGGLPEPGGDEGGLEDLMGGEDEVEPPSSPGGEGAAPMAEGLDLAAQKRLIKEQIRYEKNKGKRKILESWANRSCKSIDDKTYESGFDYMLKSKELDGLSKSHSQDATILESIHDPNKDDGLIVEWSVPEEDRMQAIQEVYDILVVESAQEPSIGEDIVANDLPTDAGDL